MAIRPGNTYTYTKSVAPKPATKPTAAKPAAGGSYGGLDPGTISHKPFMDYGQQIMQTAMDPQNDLRNREQQRMQEQVRAGLNARGLNMSGAGQGIEQQAMSDFGLDWQDRMLGRQVQGAGAFNALGSTAQGIANTGFQNAGQLGASQFQYKPPSMMMSPPSMMSSGPSRPQGAAFQSIFSGGQDQFQQRRAEEQRFADETNARNAPAIAAAKAYSDRHAAWNSPLFGNAPKTSMWTSPQNLNYFQR